MANHADCRKSLHINLYAFQRKNIRNDLSNFVCSAINWQEEGVPFDHLNKIVGEKAGAANHLLEIERCSRGEGIYHLPACLDTYRLIDRLLKWRHLGQCSWKFARAEEALYDASCWLYKHKDEVVQAVKDSTANIDGLSAYAECALSVTVCCRMLAGGETQKLAEQLFTQDDFSLPAPSISGVHSKGWNNLISYINKRPEVSESLKIAHDYFNITQSRKAATKTFLNLSTLQGCLDRLANQEYLVTKAEELGKDDTIGARKNSLIPANQLAKELPKVVAAEQNFLLEKLRPIMATFDLQDQDLRDFSAEAVVDFSAALEDFAKAMGRANKNVCVAKIKLSQVRTLRKEAVKIAAAVQRGATALLPGKMQVVLPRLAQTSLNDITPLLDLLKLTEESLKKAAIAMPGEPSAPKGYDSPLAKDKAQIPQKAKLALEQLDGIGEAMSL
ncbi:MAG: hypothetical protein IJ849_12855 [Selenomonadaceae bacterium]|nr:hypothetical protein [Selenomonadaceae bacterium]